MFCTFRKLTSVPIGHFTNLAGLLGGYSVSNPDINDCENMHALR